MTSSHLYASARTPFGRFGGALADVRPDDLSAHTLTAVLDRVPGLDPDEVPSGRLTSTPELIAWLRDRSDPSESVLRPA